MVNELSLNVYAVQHTKNGQYDCGLPFVARDDEAAKQMVSRTLADLKDRDLCFEDFALIRVGLWYPDRLNPLSRKPVVTVCSADELLRSDGGDVNA